ncbi:hypothetical protein GCM10011571_33710 [Marinithermofilum abyssi]|uniref:Uncharacterized protein n=1 Tax=Marinithermofilum abyssi TaxID=1571185 RepID=A0A8J2VK42_9BACL|nr:hypothetical protein GCM10011571_33710 [Marinithermofilum abyssi]
MKTAQQPAGVATNLNPQPITDRPETVYQNPHWLGGDLKQ